MGIKHEILGPYLVSRLCVIVFIYLDASWVTPHLMVQTSQGRPNTMVNATMRGGGGHDLVEKASMVCDAVGLIQGLC